MQRIGFVGRIRTLEGIGYVARIMNPRFLGPMDLPWRIIIGGEGHCDFVDTSCLVGRYNELLILTSN